MKKTKINYDKKSDILYIVLKEGTEERFEDISENITIEYDAQDKPIGIEIFNASKFLGSTLGIKSTPSVAIPHKIR